MLAESQGIFGQSEKSQGKLYQKIENIFYIASIKILVSVHIFFRN